MFNPLRELTHKEKFDYLSGRRSIVDSNKSFDELSIGEIMILKHHPDEFELWKRERLEKLRQLSNQDDAPIGELIRELYGRKN